MFTTIVRCGATTFRSTLYQRRALHLLTPSRLTNSLTFRAFASKTQKVDPTRFTKTHEYCRPLTDKTAIFGVTDFAQKELGDVVYIDLPKVGQEFESGQVFASVESVKAASSIYAPVDLKVTKVNTNVSADCSLINKSAEKDGWLITAEMKNPSQMDKLLNKSNYDKICQSSPAH